MRHTKTQRATESQVVHVRIKYPLLSRIDKQARHESREDRTEMIRVLIERGLAQKETL